MLQGPFRGLLTHLYSVTKSCSKLQRSFWLVMNGPLSDVSTHHAVISWLSHEVLWLTLWHILTVEWRTVTLIGTGKSACWSFFSVYVMVGLCTHWGFLLQAQRCLTMSFQLSKDYNQTYHNNINPAQQTLYQQFDCPVHIPPLSLVLWGLPFKKGSVLKRRRYMKSSTETRLNKDKQVCCLGKPLSGVSKRRQWK